MKISASLILIFLCLACASFAQDKKERKVQIITNYGNIIVKLYDETPLHRDNFLMFAETGKMNGSIFHRVIKDFMIQGGSAPGSGGAESMGNTIPAEILPQYFHKKGALAAARKGDQVNPKRESSGSQFYIVHGRVSTASDLQVMQQRMKTKLSDEQIAAYTTVGGTPHLDSQYTVFGEVIEGLDVVDKIAAAEVLGSKPSKDITIQLKIIE